MNPHTKGILVTSLGVLFIVPETLFIRLIEADATVIAFWRGLIAGSLIAVFVAIRFGGTKAFSDVLRAGPAAWSYILFFSFSGPGFVLAISLTSVANVVFILASAPVFAAIFSRFFLDEPISGRMIWTMFGVFAGLGVILWGSHETEGASWQGDLVALAVSASFAAGLTSVRRVKSRSMVPGVPMALALGAMMVFPFANVFAPLVHFWPLFLGHGLLIAFSASLLVMGPRYLSSAEVSLLFLLESVLAPLLVWYVLGENPGLYAILGGAIVLAVLLASNLWVMVRIRRA
jgi:drug/metabolite transporter (DMT)-like permease